MIEIFEYFLVIAALDIVRAIERLLGYEKMKCIRRVIHWYAYIA